MWAAQPTYRRVWGQASLGNIFYVYALKSILVHSERVGIILLEPTITGGCGDFPKHGGATAPPAPLLLTPVLGVIFHIAKADMASPIATMYIIC